MVGIDPPTGPLGWGAMVHRVPGPAEARGGPAKARGPAGPR